MLTVTPVSCLQGWGGFEQNESDRQVTNNIEDKEIRKKPQDRPDVCIRFSKYTSTYSTEVKDRQSECAEKTQVSYHGLKDAQHRSHRVITEGFGTSDFNVGVEGNLKGVWNLCKEKHRTISNDKGPEEERTIKNESIETHAHSRRGITCADRDEMKGMW